MQGLMLLFWIPMMVACNDSPRDAGAVPNAGAMDTPGFKLSSPAFNAGAEMPRPYVCDGYDDLGVSPPVKWTAPPKGTQSLALICVDPDGRDWVHWMLWDIAAGARQLPPDAVRSGTAGVEGQNSYKSKNGKKKMGWGGPCPPKGHGVHHYVFTLWALDVEHTGLLPETTTLTELEDFAAKHKLGVTHLVGTFER